MSFPRYPAYKPSGVEWLGEVPEHWVPNKICAISSLKGRLGWQGLKADEYREQGPYVVSSAHFQDRRIQWEECPRVSQERYETDENIQLAANDVLLMKDGAAMGKLAFIDQLPGPACLNSHLLLFRPREVGGAPAYYPKFAFYFMQTGYFQEHIRINGTGATFLGISQDAIGRYQICLPSLPEQAQIVTFLEHETAKIDALIAEQQRLIELLQEKRQAVISHAVTKGLNPHAPMKDSGVEWLGEVPEHWSLAAVGHRYSVQLGKMLDAGQQTGNHRKPYLRVADVQWDSINTEELPEMDFPLETEARYRLKRGDLLVNEGGSYVGRSAIWHAPIEVCYYQKALHRLRAYDETRESPYFMYWLMEHATRLGVFIAGGNQTTIDHLTAEQLRRYRFGFPSLEEQEEIASYLRLKTGKLQQLTTQAENLVAVLLERRAALISAAVTGQIDVRGLVPEAEAA